MNLVESLYLQIYNDNFSSYFHSFYLPFFVYMSTKYLECPTFHEIINLSSTLEQLNFQFGFFSKKEIVKTYFITIKFLLIYQENQKYSANLNFYLETSTIQLYT